MNYFDYLRWRLIVFALLLPSIFQQERILRTDITDTSWVLDEPKRKFIAITFDVVCSTTTSFSICNDYQTSFQVSDH